MPNAAASNLAMNCFSDALYIELVKSGFYICLLIIVVCAFGKQIRELLSSLGDVKFAGTSITLGDRKVTAASYVLLAETFIEVLSLNQNIYKFREILTLPQAEKLAHFALRYSVSVQEEDWNEEMLRNIAFLLHLFERHEQSILLFDRLLKMHPERIDFLDNKAYALLRSGVARNVEESEAIYIALIERFPTNARNYHRLALCKSQLKKHAEALAYMNRFLDFETNVDFMTQGIAEDLFFLTCTAEPADCEQLRERISLFVEHERKKKIATLSNAKLTNATS